MAVSPVSGNVYIGAKNYGGFGMSVDSGISFTMPTTTYCYSIYADEYGNVFAGLGGVLRKFKDGNYNLGSTVLAVSGGSVYNICKGEQGELYAVMKQKIFMSTDTGNTWVLKSEITSGSSEFRHVIASANNKILYGKTRVNLQETDTSFTTSTTVNCYTGMNSIKTANGFMFFPERSNYWSLSYDNGITFSKYYGSGFNSLINGATVPSMSYEAKNVNGLATYNNKIYYAGANCVIIVLSKGTGSTELVEKEKENQISIYPNPITKNQILTIEGVQSDDKIIVRNVVGKEVFNSIGRNKISLQENKSGIYFLTIMSDNKTKTLKFIVK